MQVQITTEVVMKPKNPYRRYSYRSLLLPSAVIAGILLPLLFLRAAFLAIEAGASICPSIGCLGWEYGFFKDEDPFLEFTKEWSRNYTETANGETQIDRSVVESAPDSLDDLIAEIGGSLSSDERTQTDLSAFVLKIKAMLLKMENRVETARLRSSYYRHVASQGTPKTVHCLALRLSEEYSVNSAARSSLPKSEFFSRLTDTSYLHVALLTDNVLAASVAISSAVNSSLNPEKLVFHVITDKKTYFAMHAWFAMHQVQPAFVEVKGLHQFDCSPRVRALITETIDEIRQCESEYKNKNTEPLRPTVFSLFNYLKIHLPQFFPKLERVILLEDDVVVRRDLTKFWELDLRGNVIGAIGAELITKENRTLCADNKFAMHLNFSNPVIQFSSAGADKEDQCAWSWGINIFDLRSWRSTNITENYQFWLKKNRESEFMLWPMGSLPPALLAFNDHVHPIDPSWVASGLGLHEPDASLVQSASVLHFNGPSKPWLEIAFPRPREIWRAHLNSSNEFLRGCGVVE